MEDIAVPLHREPLGDDDATEAAKAAARRHALEGRATLSDQRRVDLSAMLVARLEALLGDADVVAAYVPYRSEPDCLPLVERLRERGARVLVPKLGPGLSRDWAWFTGADDLAVRSPGRPPEPSGEALGADALAQADAVVVPALGVDLTGYRLGRGGGWYDRALLHVAPGTPVYAAVFDEEVLEDEPVPRGSHDVPVTHLVTPTRTLPVAAATSGGPSAVG